LLPQHTRAAPACDAAANSTTTNKTTGRKETHTLQLPRPITALSVVCAVHLAH
jgi:hypothetical protein